MDKKKKTFKNRGTNKGGNNKDLTQKYSLESLDQSYELGGFSYSNIMVGLLAIGTIVYMIQHKNEQ